jgi:hypothetical protein
MDRRGFVASLALAPLVLRGAAATQPARRSRDDVFLVGVGYAGMTVLQLMERRGVTTANWMIWSGDRGWREMGLDESCLHRDLRGRSPVLTARHEVWERLSHCRTLPPTSVVAVGLGGLTGSMLIGPLLEQLTDVSTVHVVATTPLRFEGRERAKRAEDALWEIRQSDAGYTVFDLERVKNEMQPVGRYSGFLKAVDCRMAGAAVRAMADPMARVVNGVAESPAPIIRPEDR